MKITIEISQVREDQKQSEANPIIYEIESMLKKSGYTEIESEMYKDYYACSFVLIEESDASPEEYLNYLNNQKNKLNRKIATLKRATLKQ